MLIKRFSRRTFFKIFFYFILLGGLTFICLWYGLDIIEAELPRLLGVSNDSNIFPRISALMEVTRKHLLLCALPTLSIIFLLTALATWIGVRNTLKKLLSSSDHPTPEKRIPQKSEGVSDKAVRRRHDKQMYLYLFSLLQRQGRFMDFLSEDLTVYEDAQIGAAVRGIHENCKKVIDKNLSPKPVIDKDEGETVTVEIGFDPAAIKLTGNVSGEPPFQGILRHRGWQSKKEDLPTFSGTQATGILAPAEVEIQ